MERSTPHRVIRREDFKMLKDVLNEHSDRFGIAPGTDEKSKAAGRLLMLFDNGSSDRASLLRALERH